MRLLFSAVLLIALPCAAQAFAPDTTSLPTVAQLRLAPAVIAPMIQALKNQPLRFAVGAALGADQTAGTWDEPQLGVARWRLRVASEDAKSLSFRLDALSLPKHAVLYLYSASGDDLQGPFTAEHNGSLWTPMVRADEAVLEARMPYDQKSRFSVTIAQVFHGYRAFRRSGGVIAKGAMGDSEACEVDVACPAGDAWDPQIRATVLLSIDNQYLCSGTLINNSAQDDRALILTAKHCDINSGNVTTTQAYFNVEKSSCGARGDGPINDVLPGKRVLARTRGTQVSDYTLFELARKPPSSFNVYYAGWDTTTSAPRAGVAIHHPSGDDKKISTYTQAAIREDDFCIGAQADCSDGFSVDAWEVFWSRGTTEQGSSGSGLFNQQGRLVGTLSGGEGACSGTANNGRPDYFARLDRAWTASSSTGTTLESALTAGGSCSALDGKEPGPAAAAACSGDEGGGSFGWLSLLPLGLAAWRRRRASLRRVMQSAALMLGLALPFASQAYAPELASLPIVSQVQVQSAMTKAAQSIAKGQPLQFAVGTALNAGVNDGTWDEPQAGLARWRLRINSNGARALNFRFDALKLPEHAQLYLYTDHGNDVQGPYTAQQNGRFVTPLVRSEDAVLEARMPIAEKAQFSLGPVTAFHAFRDLSSKSFPNTTGTSGSCETDVACPVGRDYRNEVRATVLLTIVNGAAEYLCSGSLVNNTAEQGRPLVLTANHCGISSANVTQAIAYFNVQRSACASGADGGVTQNIAGRSVLAGTSGRTVSDYTLFELASRPPSSFDAYYAGWDARNTAPTSGAVMHHPAGDDKKISTYTQAARKVDNVRITGDGLLGLGGFTVNTWSVTWASGTTEPGSSGSGLLDQHHRIVGTLSGGNGNCSGTSNNGADDYFARLDQAWTADSVTGVTMKSVLDAGNTGSLVLDGKDASKLAGNGGDRPNRDNGGGGLGWLGLLPLALAGLLRQRGSRAVAPQT